MVAMSDSAAPRGPISVEAYLDLERMSETRHEYVAGGAHAHAGGTRRHDVISGNIFALLWTTSRGGRCRVHTADRILRTSGGTFYYQDLMVVFPPEGESEDDESLFEDSPCLVVEVTSLSTENIDRRENCSLTGALCLWRDT